MSLDLNYLPLSGETMTGDIHFSSQYAAINKTTTDGELLVGGGISWDNGAHLVLNGKDKNGGEFLLASHDGTNYNVLIGSNDGSLKWGGSNIVRSVNGNGADVNGNVSLGLNYLPLSGGTLTGGIDVNFSGEWSIGKTSNDGAIRISGGNGWDGGASLVVYGKELPYSTKGYFTIRAYNGTADKILQGRPDGTLTWDGMNIERVAQSGSEYVRYESGIQICFGGTGNNQTSTHTFQQPFISNPICIATISSDSPSGRYCTVSPTTTSVSVYKMTTNGGYWIAIGFWK